MRIGSKSAAESRAVIMVNTIVIVATYTLGLHWPTSWTNLMVVDACSKWPKNFLMKHSTASYTVRKQCQLFSCFGVPWLIVGDNETQFSLLSQNFVLRRELILSEYLHYIRNTMVK